jgi:hypothetical protein
LPAPERINSTPPPRAMLKDFDFTGLPTILQSSQKVDRGAGPIAEIADGRETL